MATKTETQIEKDIYRIIKASAVATLIGGSVYRRGMRPKNSEEEDCVVQFVSGVDGQFQNGIVNMNIYVPKIVVGNDTNKVENLKRVEEIEVAILTLLESGGLSGDEEYKFEKRQSPQAVNYDEIEQTCINTRLYFERATI